MKSFCLLRYVALSLAALGSRFSAGHALSVAYTALLIGAAPQYVAAASLTKTSAFEYYAQSGLLKKEIIEPGSSTNCLVTTYSYDGWGHKSASTTRNCNGSAGSYPGINSEAAAPGTGSLATFAERSTSATYSADGRFQVGSMNAAEHTRTSTYDPVHGGTLSSTEPNQLTAQWKYDAWGRKVLERRADGNGTSFVYEYCNTITVGGTVGTASCPNIAGAAGVYVLTTTLVKAPVDIQTGTHGGANGTTQKTYYDVLNRPIRLETAVWDGSSAKLQYIDTEYDALGRIYRVSKPYFGGATPVWVATSYDWLNRPKQVTYPDNSKSSTTYQGLSVTVTDNLLHTATQVRNVADQLVQIIDAKGKSMTRTYDPFGNLLTTTDSAGNTTSLSFDTRGRKIGMADPDMGSWTYDYNALGELVKQTDAKTQVTQLSYDKLGRLISKVQPSLNVNWYHDKKQDGTACGSSVGRLCETVAANGYARKHVYDSLSRPVSTTVTVGAAAYTSSLAYDSNGRVDTIDYPSGSLSIRNQYSIFGDLIQVVDVATPSLVYWKLGGINAEGQIYRHTYGNNVTNYHNYDPLTGRLKQSFADANSGLQNLFYQYDTVGNVTQRYDAITGVKSTFTYDELNRMKTESRVGGGVTSPQTISYDFDDVGNIVSRSDVGTYTYGPPGGVRPHAVTSVTGTVNGQANPTYSYDDNGNLNQIAVGSTVLRGVTWNNYNKVDSISQTVNTTTNQLEFLYDSEGDRVRERLSQNGNWQRTTVYLNTGGLFYEEETTSGVVKKKHYINSPVGIIAVLTLNNGNWSRQFWHKDALGSPNVITDANGAVSERQGYEPFGKRRNANGTTDLSGTLQSNATRRGFTGHEHDDEVDVINMNGRIFDPAIGRFLSPDPTLQAPTFMQAYNRYSYMWNNPLGGTDPTGYKNLLTTVMDISDKLAGPIVSKVLTGKYGYQIKSLAVAIGSTFCTFGQTACLAAGNAALASAYGASPGDALKAGAISAGTAWAMNYVGNLTTTTTADGTVLARTTGQKLGNIAGHAAVGCASAAASGGKCGAGAVSGGFSSALTNYVPKLAEINVNSSVEDKIFGGVNASIAGGIGSLLGGGDFAGGALTGAMGYLYNQISAHWRDPMINIANRQAGLQEDTGKNRAAEAAIRDFLTITPEKLDLVSDALGVLSTGCYSVGHVPCGTAAAVGSAAAKSGSWLLSAPSSKTILYEVFSQGVSVVAPQGYVRSATTTLMLKVFEPGPVQAPAPQKPTCALPRKC